MGFVWWPFQAEQFRVSSRAGWGSPPAGYAQPLAAAAGTQPNGVPTTATPILTQAPTTPPVSTPMQPAVTGTATPTAVQPTSMGAQPLWAQLAGISQPNPTPAQAAKSQTPQPQPGMNIGDVLSQLFSNGFFQGGPQPGSIMSMFGMPRWGGAAPQGIVSAPQQNVGLLAAGKPGSPW